MALDFAKLLATEKAKVVPTTPAPVTNDPSPQPVPQSRKETEAGPITELAPASDAPIGAVVEYPGLYDLKEKILSLEKAIATSHPAMDSLLQTIHRNLQKDPELIHMLQPEDRAKIFAGLQKKTQTKIVSETVKSASSGKNKGLKNLGLEDL